MSVTWVPTDYFFVQQDASNQSLVIQPSDKHDKKDIAIQFIIPSHETHNSLRSIYAEFRIQKLGTDGCAAIGVAAKNFSKIGSLPGWNSKSWGYHSDDGGLWSESGREAFKILEKYGSGDVIGCGITQNSQIFWTRNGKIVGAIYLNKKNQASANDFLITLGTDSHTSSFKLVPQSEWLVDPVSVLVGNKFPNDILVNLFADVISSFADIRNLSLVCKQWNQTANENSSWKALTMKRWPSLASSTKIKNWKKVAERRLLAEKAGKQKKSDFQQRQVIEGCNGWEFECPLKFNSLTVINDKMHFCSKCQQNVFYCSSRSELDFNVKLNRCVAFDAVTLLDPKSATQYPTEQKVAIFGSPGVGKKTLVSALTGEKGKELENDGIYYSHSTNSSYFDDIKFEMKISAADELLVTMVRMSEVFVVVFSLDDFDSYQAAENYIDEISRVKDVEQFPILLIGNKSDLPSETMLRSLATAKAKKHEGAYVEISAKSMDENTRMEVVKEMHQLVNQHHVEHVVMGKRVAPFSFRRLLF